MGKPFVYCDEGLTDTRNLSSVPPELTAKVTGYQLLLIKPHMQRETRRWDLTCFLITLQLVCSKDRRLLEKCKIASFGDNRIVIQTFACLLETRGIFPSIDGYVLPLRVWFSGQCGLKMVRFLQSRIH